MPTRTGGSLPSWSFGGRPTEPERKKSPPVVVNGVQERVKKLVLAVSPGEGDVLGRACPLGKMQGRTGGE
jgi:hypothetical protein